MIKSISNLSQYFLILISEMTLLMMIVYSLSSICHQYQVILERQYLKFMISNDLKEASSITKLGVSQYLISGSGFQIQYDIKNKKLRRVLNGSWSRYVYHQGLDSITLEQKTGSVQANICFNTNDCVELVFWAPQL